MPKNDRATSLLLIAGLVLAALGQFYFSYRREYVWDGVLFWFVAVISLSWVLRRCMRGERGLTRRHGTKPRWLLPVLERPQRVLMAVGGTALAVTAGWLARRRLPSDNFSDLLILWMSGVASYVVAFLPSLPSPSELRRLVVQRRVLRDWLTKNRDELVGVAVLASLAFFVRLYRLEHIPANLSGDEGTWAMEGLAMLDGRLANPFATRWFAFPSMSFLVWGVSMRVFGETVAGVRAVSALIGGCSVLATYLLAKEIRNRRIAWLGALILAIGHYHLHFSRLAVNNVADSLLVTVALYLLIRGLRTRRALCFASAGAVMGLGWYGYFGSRLVGIIAALYLLWRMIAEPRFAARYGRHLGVLAVAAVAVAAPLLLHYAAHPTAFTEGYDRVSIFASGWLSREREITGRGTLDLLAQQFWKSLTAFNYTLDPTFWYRARIPLLDAVSGVLFVFGLIWCAAHWRWPSSGLLLTWFWAALLTGWVMTENPPSSQRLVIVTPALALFVAVGLDRLEELCLRVLGASEALARVAAGVTLLTIAGLNLRYYFLIYTPSHVYGNPTAELTTHLARRLARQDDEKVVYLHGPPFVYWDFGTLRFMARGVSGLDIPPLGQGTPPEPDLSRGAHFVFHPARVDELEAVRKRSPGGTEKRFRSRADGSLLYATYEVEPW